MIVEHTTATVSIGALNERARAYAEAARSAATRRAYATAWRLFTAWCSDHVVDALPANPHTLALFIADCADRPATLRRKLASIAVMHRAAGYDSPTGHGIVRATLAGICRERGIAPRPKAALLVDELRSALHACGERRIDVRDRALLLIGFAGALRRSELVGLDVDDVRFEGGGRGAAPAPLQNQPRGGARGSCRALWIGSADVSGARAPSMACDERP